MKRFREIGVRLIIVLALIVLGFQGTGDRAAIGAGDRQEAVFLIDHL